MRKLILLALMIAISAISFGQRQTVKTVEDTVVGAETVNSEISLTGQYESMVVEVQFEELGDSIDGTADLEAQVNDVWVSLSMDSTYANVNTETDASESSGTLTWSTDSDYWYIEVLNPPAPNYRLNISGSGDNDKESGTAFKLNYYLK